MLFPPLGTFLSQLFLLNFRICKCQLRDHFPEAFLDPLLWAPAVLMLPSHSIYDTFPLLLLPSPKEVRPGGRLQGLFLSTLTWAPAEGEGGRLWAAGG